MAVPTTNVNDDQNRNYQQNHHGILKNGSTQTSHKNLSKLSEQETENINVEISTKGLSTQNKNSTTNQSHVSIFTESHDPQLSNRSNKSKTSSDKIDNNNNNTVETFDKSKRTNSKNKIFHAKRHLNIVSQKKHFKWVVLGGSLLSYNAGFINGVTYGGTFGMPTAHVTGYATKLAIEIVDDRAEFIFRFASLWFTFMFGSFLSALLIPFESFKITRCYARTLTCIGSCILIAFFLGLYFPEEIYYLYFCSLGCGMQNAMTTKYSGNVIRTTHLSGTTTDIGIIIAHMVRGRYKEFWKLELYMPMVFSYVVGSICGYMLFIEIGFYSLLVSVGITTLVGIKHALIVSGLYKRKFWKVFLGIPEIVHRHARTFGQSISTDVFRGQNSNNDNHAGDKNHDSLNKSSTYVINVVEEQEAQHTIDTNRSNVEDPSYILVDTLNRPNSLQYLQTSNYSNEDNNVGLSLHTPVTSGADFAKNGDDCNTDEDYDDENDDDENDDDDDDDTLEIEIADMPNQNFDERDMRKVKSTGNLLSNVMHGISPFLPRHSSRSNENDSSIIRPASAMANINIMLNEEFKEEQNDV